MTAYLDIDDWKIGPPPNWRNFISKKGKLKAKKYIAAVEEWITANHKRFIELIHELDSEREDIGYKTEAWEAYLKDMKTNLITAQVLVDKCMSGVTQRADQWRLASEEYARKYREETDDE
jgi:hypothetical protein